MNAEVIDTPFHVRLVGKRGVVADNSYGPTGKGLMDQLWAVVREKKIANRGLNHWAYLPAHELFTGVELTDPTADVEGLESLEVVLPRYARAVHVGPYTGLPAFWAGLKTRLTALGEAASGVGMEIYGHWCENPAEFETTVLIGLATRGG